MTRFSTLAALLVACFTIGCSDDDVSGETTAGSGGSGGDVTSGGAPSWTWEGCEPGTAPQGSDCIEAGDGAGIDSCAAGFMSDGADGCTAVLPAAPCGDGQMAIPGESACRDIAPCGSGTWGDIPVENTTVYVDASAAGGGDGSVNAPFTLIKDGIDAAASGAIVAIAAGNYAEDPFDDFGRPVRIWGRCPSMVTVRTLSVGGVGSEIRGLSTVGPGWGINVTNGDVLIDSVWVHDNGNDGIFVVGGAKVTVVNSLVERATESGLRVRGAELVVQQSVVRGTLADAGIGGEGIYSDPFQSVAPTVTVESSVFETNLATGVAVLGGDATVSGSVIRDTSGNPSAPDVGIGVLVRSGTLVLSDSELSSNLALGVVAEGSDATVEQTTIRDTALSQTGNGTGLLAVYSQVGGASVVAVTHSVVDGGHYVGINAADSDLTLDGVIVRNIDPDGQSGHGRGINAEHAGARGQRSSLRVSSSVVEATHDQGLLAAGVDVLVERTRISDTQAQVSDGLFGRGISFQVANGEPPDGTVRYSIIERSTEMGVFVEHGQLLMEDTVVRDTSSATNGSAGWGVGIQRTDPAQTASGRIVRCHIAGSREVAVGSISSALDIDTVLVSGTAANGLDLVGDGIAFVSLAAPATGSVIDSRVEDSARAGLAVFGSSVALSGSTLVCNPIDMNGADEAGSSYEVSDQGGNVCACGDAIHACKLESAVLEPPSPRP